MSPEKRTREPERIKLLFNTDKEWAQRLPKTMKVVLSLPLPSAPSPNPPCYFQSQGSPRLSVGRTNGTWAWFSGLGPALPRSRRRPCPRYSQKKKRGGGLGRGRLLPRPESSKVHFLKFACPLGGEQRLRAELRTASSPSTGYPERWRRLLHQPPKPQL